MSCTEAQKLYDSGCTYALQQEFVAAKELFSLLCAERASGNGYFLSPPYLSTHRTTLLRVLKRPHHPVSPHP